MAPRVQRLLVAGGAGFLGSAFTRQRLQEDPEIRITVLDRMTDPAAHDRLAEAEPDRRLQIVQGDVRDAGIVNQLAREADATVNFASESIGDGGLGDPGDSVRTGVFGTYVLLEAARKFRHSRFLQVSTDEVYGPIKDGRRSEGEGMDPHTPRAAVQASAELLVGAYHTSFGMATVVTRGAPTYGPFQSAIDVIPRFITNALDGRPLTINGDGSASREYLHVDDHVAGIARILWKGEPGGTYNLGAGTEVTLREAVDTILGLCNRPASLRRHVRAEGNQSHRIAVQCRRARQLGWEPRYRFRAGVQLTIEWYRKHEGWWRVGDKWAIAQRAS